MENILLKLSNKNPVGVYSACTANELVIEAVLEHAKEHDSIAVIEATANQVNQFGGYTGMNASDYRDYVYEIAKGVGFDVSKIVLGGDHLGPLTWTHLGEDEAMANASQLVYDYVRAGYTKIHLDTSMRLRDDSTTERLSNETIARRSAQLAKSCLKAFDDLKEENPNAVFPAFIIGSEVPIPGGATEKEDTLEVTSPADFKETYATFKEVFTKHHVMRVFDAVIAIVVQPGVEFGDEDLFLYNRDAAHDLTTSLKSEFETLAFEGHSTDYQTPQSLRNMVEDGIVILKVGPALTFGLREALFALSHIEKELIEEDKQAQFIETLEKAMMDEPDNWQKHYHGDEEALRIKRKYSYSDRSRYYLPVPVVAKAIEVLCQNLDEKEIPMTLLSQYLPYQYRNIKEGKIPKQAKAIIKDYVKVYLDEYQYATQVETLKN